MPGNRPLIFKEQGSWVVLCDLFLLLFTTAFILANIDTFFFYKLDDLVTARILTLAFLFIFCPLLFLGRTYLADIHVDDDGIGLWLWGRRWKYIRWVDVKNLTLITIPTYVGNDRIKTGYCLFVAGMKSSINRLNTACRFMTTGRMQGP